MADLGLVPRNAANVAEEYGLTDMAKNGLGYAWQQDFVRSAIGKNFDYGGLRESGGQALFNKGLLYSGAMDAELPAEIANIGQGIASDAFNQATAQSDVVANEARNTEFQLAIHDDRMDLDRMIVQAQLDAQKKNWWDYTIEAASVGSNLVSSGAATGLWG